MSDDIKTVLGDIAKYIEGDNEKLSEELLKSEKIQECLLKAQMGDLDGFYFGVLYPLSNAVDGLVAMSAKTHEGRFILKHSQFIERQFKKLIVKYEGSACCADKSGTIMRRLFLFYEKDQEISFDYTQEYTYHLPNTVFKTHAEIINFFEGVYSLYYGNAEKYIKALLAV